jgi:hypothetical protein
MAEAAVILRWTLSFAFTLNGCYCLARCTGQGHRRMDRVGDLAHGGMAAVMLAMLWAWDHGDAWGVQALVFAAAGAWFIVRALAGGETKPTASPGRGLWHQGLAMTGMAWMLLRMPAMPATAGHVMAGMTGQHVGGLDAPTTALGAYLLIAPAWWVWRMRAAPMGSTRAAVLVCAGGSGCTRRAGLVAVADPVCQALMSLAMGTALLILW